MSDIEYSIRFGENPAISDVENFLKDVLGEHYTERNSSRYGGISGPRAFYSWPGDKNNLKIFVPEPLVSNGRIDIRESLKGRFGGKYNLV